MVLKILKRYKFFIGTLIALLIMTLISRDLGRTAVTTIGSSLREMLLVLPPIFILLGLLDIWVPRETMMKLMGEGSGLKGILLAIFWVLLPQDHCMSSSQ